MEWSERSEWSGVEWSGVEWSGERDANGVEWSGETLSGVQWNGVAAGLNGGTEARRVERIGVGTLRGVDLNGAMIATECLQD